jgi:hypothetical protein
MVPVISGRAQIQASNNFLHGVSAPGFLYNFTNVPANNIYTGSNPTLICATLTNNRNSQRPNVRSHRSAN